MNIKIIDRITEVYKKLYEKEKIEIGNHAFITLPNGKKLKTYVDSTSHDPRGERLFFSLGLNQFDFNVIRFNVIRDEEFRVNVQGGDLNFVEVIKTINEMESQVKILLTQKRTVIDGKEYKLVPVEQPGCNADDIPY